jgi:hypothetical protein
VANSLKNGSMTLSFGFLEQNNDVVNPISANPPNLGLTLQFADSNNGGGTAPFGDCDRVHVSRRSLPASGTETLDLSAGALTDALGGPLALARLKIAAVLLLPTTAAGLVIGGAGANPLSGMFADPSDKVALGNGPAGGLWAVTRLDATGWAVDPTHKNLLLANDSGSLIVYYTLLLAGKST